MGWGISFKGMNYVKIYSRVGSGSFTIPAWAYFECY